MKQVKRFEQLTEALRERGVKRRVAVVWASDECTRGAVARAIRSGFAEAIFAGCKAEIEADTRYDDLRDLISIIDAPDPDAAAAAAVALVRSGDADVVMKGMINTDNLLRAILNKEHGILPKGNVLTHVTLTEIPGFDRLLMLCDVAVIPYPTDEQREAQVRYTASLARNLGIEEPRIALTHCSEKVDERHFPFTSDYRRLAHEAAEGRFGRCIVDGPLDVLTSCSPEGMKKKHIDSPIGGKADVLIFPDIEAGNTFYKTITFFAGASVAGMLCGTLAPVVLASRGDTEDSKFYSLAFASL